MSIKKLESKILSYDSLKSCDKEFSACRLIARHGFFGRRDGVSVGNFESLNCSKHVGDESRNVLKNLDYVADDLGASKIVTLSQIHSNICLEINENSKSDMEADAMITAVPGIAIGILTADCAPILFFDDCVGVVGAAHAGWRGAVSGIIAATVEKMQKLGCSPSNIKAAIGPCISRNSYEVDDDFKRNFTGRGECFCIINAKLHFDLPKYCCERLLEAGLQSDNIDVFAVDTFADSQNYFSYRFANKHSAGVCGRNLSAICIE